MLFRKKIERACDYCIHGTRVDEDLILCVKKGMKEPGNSCRKFKYDPLKRKPSKAKPLDFSKYDKENFSL